MSQNIPIGAKVKELRTEKRYTLKYLSEQTGLSIGFLSQLERGLSNIAVDSLWKIAKVFDVDVSVFFTERKHVNRLNVPVRSFDLSPTYISPQIISYIHSSDETAYDLLPRVYHLMPIADTDSYELEMYSHSGEEFIYVLEGIMTMYVGANQYELYPGDSILIESSIEHNWMNRTNKEVKMLAVNIPNPMKQK